RHGHDLTGWVGCGTGHDLEQQACGGVAELAKWLLDSGQGWRDQPTRRLVVEADDGQLIRHADATFMAGAQYAISDRVRKRQNGPRRALASQPAAHRRPPKPFIVGQFAATLGEPDVLGQDDLTDFGQRRATSSNATARRGRASAATLSAGVRPWAENCRTGWG